MAYLNPSPLEYTSNRLAGKVVFVTGASSGIGAAAVSLFAREGANVIAAARRRERLETLAAEMERAGLTVASVGCDVTSEDSVRHAIDFAVERFGRLDGAFNNAGQAGGRAPVHEAKTEDFDRIVGTNLRGVFLCMKHEIPAMLRTGGGSIVNTSSIGGLRGGAANSIYAASKFGLEGLTRCAALDYARQGIRVNSIAPGATRSEMFDRWMPDEEARTALASRTPMNYIAHPEDMARYALFLLSDESRWTTGAVIPCDGGSSA